MEPNAKRPRAPRLLLLWPAPSRLSRAPWATSCRPEGAARRTHPSERVGHPQKQEKADPSVDFFERRKQDAFAWGRPRDDSVLAHPRMEHRQECLCTGCRAEVPGATLKAKKKKQVPHRPPRGGLLGMTAKTNSAKHPGPRNDGGRPGLQAAGLKAAASRTHPSERVGHPQRQRKADSSVDFSNGESRMLSPGADRVMTAAWRVRRGRNTAANACAAPAAWKAALRKRQKQDPSDFSGPRDFALGRERCSRWALNNTKGGAPAKARKSRSLGRLLRTAKAGCFRLGPTSG